MTEQELFGLVGKLVAFVASGAGGAFLLIKFGGEKWIENKFLKDLELFKTQKLHEFDLLLTRKIKWHEKEHEVLSESWKKLIQAHTALKQAISMLKELPDLDRMLEDEFKNFIDKSDLSDDEKEYMRTPAKGNLNRAYSRILDNRALSNAHKEFLGFHAYFDENKIFLRPHIKEKFLKADDYIWSAWVSRKMSFDERDGKRDFLLESYDTENKKIKPLVEEIEIAVQKELFPEQYQGSVNQR